MPCGSQPLELTLSIVCAAQPLELTLLMVCICPLSEEPICVFMCAVIFLIHTHNEMYRTYKSGQRDDLFLGFESRNQHNITS